MIKSNFLLLIILLSFNILTGCTGGGEAAFTPNKSITLEEDEEANADFAIEAVTLAPGNYGLGANLDVVVEFSKRAIFISGTPSITINVGGTNRTATYVSGSATKFWTFRYTVVGGEVDADGVDIQSPINPGGAVITDFFAQPWSDLTFANQNVATALVEANPPALLAINKPADNTYILGQNIDFTIDYSEAVNVSGTPRIGFNFDSGVTYFDYVSGSGTTQLTFRRTVQSPDDDSDGISFVGSLIDLNGGSIQDDYNNAGSISFLPPAVGGILVDSFAPNITSITPPANALYNLGSNIDFIINYDANVIVSGTPRIQLNVGGTTVYANYLSGSGTSALTFRYTTALGHQDLDGLGIATTIDLNSGTINSVSTIPADLTFSAPNLSAVLIDAKIPAITNVIKSDGTYILGSNVDFTVVFDEIVNVASGTPTIQLNVGGSNYSASYVSGSGSTNLLFRYTVGNGHLDNDGIGFPGSISLAGATIRDVNSNNANLNLPAVNTSAMYVDGVVPTITSTGQSPNNIYLAGQQISFTMNYDDVVVVSGTPRIAITLNTGGTVYADYASGSGSSALVFTYTVGNGHIDGDGINVASTIDLNSGTINDSNGNASSLNFAALITTGILVDGDAPEITSVNPIPTNDTYIIGENLDFTVNYDENVIITGTPRLSITLASGTVYADYQSGSGSQNIVFRYTVAASDLDSDGIAVATSIDLNGGTIRDVGGNNGDLTFSALATGSINIDGVVPSISSITPPANDTYIDSETLNFVVNFSENVLVTGTPRIQINLATGGPVYATYASGSGTNAWTFSYTVASTHNDGDGISLVTPLQLNGGTIADASGNNASLTYTLPNTASINIDGIAPTITGQTQPADATYLVGQNLDFTLTYDENVVVTGTPQIDITLDSGAITADYLSGTGTNTLTFRYVVNAGALDVNGIAVATSISLNGGSINDAGANNADLTFSAMTTTGVLVDGDAPEITSVNPIPTNDTYIVGENLDFTVNYDENVVVTGTPRLSITLASGTVYADYLSGSGSQNIIFRYTVATNDLDSDGIAVATSIDLNSGTIRDGGGNNADLTFSALATGSINIDGALPTISSITPAANDTYINGESLNFTVNFSENVTVTGTPRIQINLATGGPVYATYASGTGTNALVFTYTVGGAQLDTDGISLVSPLQLNSGTIADSNGNNATLTYTLPNTSSVNVDGIFPTITGQNKPADGTYTIGQNLDFTIDYDENVVVTGSPQLDITLNSGAVSASYLSGSGTSSLTFRYTVVATDLDLNGIAVATTINLNGGSIDDVAGNNADLTFAALATGSVLVDAVIPTITSVTPIPGAGTYTIGQNLDFTVNYDENVTITGTPRLTITLGSGTVYADYNSGSGSQNIIFRYTVGAGDLDNDGIAVATSIDLNSGTIADSAGNNGDLTFSALSTNTVNIDGVAPTITSVTLPADSTYKQADTLSFTLNYNENSTIAGGTPRIAITLTSGTVYANYVSGSGTTAHLYQYTVGATDIDLDGIVMISPLDVNGATISDANSNNQTDFSYTTASTAGILINGVAPIITGVSATGGTYGESQDIDITVSFSAIVNVTGSPRMQLDIGGTTKYATYNSGTGSTDLVFRYTVEAGLNDGDGIGNTSPLDLNSGTIQDGATNNANLTHSFDSSAILVDTSAPSLTSSSVTANAWNVNGDHIDLTMNFSKSVIVTGSPRIQLDIGGVTKYAVYNSGSGTSSLVFRYTVTNGDLDETGGIANTSPIDLNTGTIKDSSNNDAALAFTLDTSAVNVDAITPTIATETGPNAATYLETNNLDFTITYSENITVSGTPRIALDIGGTTKYATYSSGSGSTAIVFRYTIEAGLIDTNGIGNTSLIDLNSGTLQDQAGNNAPLAYTINTSAVNVDSDAPTADGFSFPVQYTTAATETASILATGASQMYVTTTAGCSAGGTWEAYATTKVITLTANTDNIYYIKFRDAATNESACISDNVIHDNSNPNPPTGIGLTGDADASQSDTTTWSAATDNGPAGIEHYEIAISWSTSEANIIPGGGWTDIGAGTSGQLTAGITLDGSNNYYTLIKAIDNAGNESSIVASASWNFTAAPAQVTNVEPTTRTKDSITIGWVEPDANDPGGIVDYEVEYKLSSSGTWLTGATVTTREWTASGLSADTSYDFRVRANNASLSGPWSSSSAIETLPNLSIFDDPYQAINIGGSESNQVVSLCDSNRIFLNGSATPEITLNKHGTHAFTVPQGQYSTLKADCEFFVAGKLDKGNGNSGEGNMVWATSSWVGKEFYVNHNRTTYMDLRVYAFEAANVSIYRNGALYNNGNGGTLPSGATVAMGAETSQTFDIRDYDSYQIVSDGFIVVAAYSRGGGGANVVDPRPVLPASTKILGIPSRDAKVSAGASGTLNWLSSGGTTNSSPVNYTANATTNIDGIINGVGYYQEESIIIDSTTPTVAFSYADRNGSCMAPFVPLTMQKKKFAINVQSEWVAFASDQDVTVTWTKPDLSTGTINIQRNGGNVNPDSPRKGYDANDYPAGTIFEGNKPFQMWYEPKTNTNGADNDETILFGWN